MTYLLVVEDFMRTENKTIMLSLPFSINKRSPGIYREDMRKTRCLRFFG